MALSSIVARFSFIKVEKFRSVKILPFFSWVTPIDPIPGRGKLPSKTPPRSALLDSTLVAFGHSIVPTVSYFLKQRAG